MNKGLPYIILYLNSTGALRPCGTMSRCQRRKESFFSYLYVSQYVKERVELVVPFVLSERSLVPFNIYISSTSHQS